MIVMQVMQAVLDVVLRGMLQVSTEGLVLLLVVVTSMRPRQAPVTGAAAAFLALLATA